jgi:hypothetical protein
VTRLTGDRTTKNRVQTLAEETGCCAELFERVLSPVGLRHKNQDGVALTGGDVAECVPLGADSCRGLRVCLAVVRPCANCRYPGQADKAFLVSRRRQVSSRRCCMGTGGQYDHLLSSPQYSSIHVDIFSRTPLTYVAFLPLQRNQRRRPWSKGRYVPHNLFASSCSIAWTRRNRFSGTNVDQYVIFSLEECANNMW